MFIYKSDRTHDLLSCELHFTVKSERLLNVTGSHMHRKGGNSSETVFDRDVVMTNHNRDMIEDYLIAANAITLSAFEGHSSLQAFCIVFVCQLARPRLTKRVSRSLCDSRASYLLSAVKKLSTHCSDFDPGAVLAPGQGPPSFWPSPLVLWMLYLLYN